MSLTVACVWVQGHVPFTPLYVQQLRQMVASHLSRPFRFVCLTDQPQRRMPRGVEAIPARRPTKCRGWWAKVQLFTPGLFKGRVVYLDLDTLVVDALDPIVEYPSSFALIPDAGNWKGLYGLRVVKRFNSSVMVWDAGVNTRLYEQWTPAVARELWGDQDWIGQQMPESDRMPLAWFPRVSELKEREPEPPVKVVLVKHPKNHDAVGMYPWVRKAWGIA